MKTLNLKLLTLSFVLSVLVSGLWSTESQAGASLYKRTGTNFRTPSYGGSSTATRTASYNTASYSGARTYTRTSSSSTGGVRSGCDRYSAANIARRRADGQQIVGTSANGNAIWMKRVGSWGGRR